MQINPGAEGARRIESHRSRIGHRHRIIRDARLAPADRRNRGRIQCQATKSWRARTFPTSRTCSKSATRRWRRPPRAGQFVIVMEHEQGERIPLTLADFDPDEGTITLVIQAVGKTTREMQRNCQVGTSLYAIVGPMGIPSHIGNPKKVLCVGGGLGVAPVFPQARAYARSGAYVIGVLGFRNRGVMFWEDKFRARVRRADRLHRRRLRRDQGPRDQGHGTGARRALGHRRSAGDRAADHDEGMRGGHAAPQHPDDREPQPGDGRRHGHVRRLPRQARTTASSSRASTAPTSMPTRWTSTTSWPASHGSAPPSRKR